MFLVSDNQAERDYAFAHPTDIARSSQMWTLLQPTNVCLDMSGGDLLCQATVSLGMKQWYVYGTMSTGRN